MRKKRSYIVLLVLLVLFTGCLKNSEKKEIYEETGTISKELILEISKGGNPENIMYFDFTKEQSEIIRYAAQSFAVDGDENIYVLNGYTNEVKIFKNGKYLNTIKIETTGEVIDIFFDDIEKSIKALINSGEIVCISAALEQNKRIVPAVYTGEKRNGESVEPEIVINSLIRGKEGDSLVKYEDNHYNSEHDTKRYESLAVQEICLNAEVRFYTGEGYKSFIGYDNEGNIYLLTSEVFSNETGDFDIEQKVIKFSPELKYIGETLLQNEIEYTKAHKNIYIDIKGNVYQMINSENGVRIYKNEIKNSYMTFAPQIINSLKSKTNPTLVDIDDNKRAALSLTRTEMYNRATEAANMTWTYSPSKNGDKGASYTLPAQLSSVSSTKNMVGMPYCWGGWNTASQFKSNIANSFMAGNVQCEGGYKSNSAGTDCSGFISTVIGNSSKLGTTMIASSSLFTNINYSTLQKMDVLNDSGSHVLFYLSTLSDGTVKTIESTTGTINGGIQGVKFYSRSLAGLKNDGYIAKRYVNIKPEPVVSSIGLNVPADMKVDQTSTFMGTCSADIVKIKRLISGSTLRDVDTPVNGKYSFDVLFSSAGDKTVTVYGYTAAGKEIKISKPITVNSTINYTVPSVLKIGTTITFRGQCSSDIVKIKRLVQGSTVRDVDVPVNGEYKFDVVFATAEIKTLTVYGYNSEGREISVSKKINITN